MTAAATCVTVVTPPAKGVCEGQGGSYMPWPAAVTAVTSDTASWINRVRAQQPVETCARARTYMGDRCGSARTFAVRVWERIRELNAHRSAHAPAARSLRVADGYRSYRWSYVS